MIIIKKALAEDIEGISTIQIKCFPDSFYSRLGVYSQPLIYLHNESFMNSFPDLFYVAWDDNKIVGFVYGYENDKGVATRMYKWLLFRNILKIGLSLGLLKFTLTYIAKALMKRGKREYALVIPDNDAFVNRTHLYKIAVLPAYRGKGVAKQLLDSFVSASRMRGKRTTMLCVSKANNRAISFYEKNGFFEFSNLGNDNLLMCKNILNVYR